MSYASYSSQGYSAPPPMDPTMTLPPSFNPMFMPHNFLLPAFASSPPPKSAQTTTIFVGNIHEKCSNAFLERILRECGTVASWKRIQGAHGKPQAFGFCAFVQPDGTLRALRIIGRLRVFDKELIVKAEDKVCEELRTWFADKRKEQGKPPLEIKGVAIPADDDDRKGDKEVLERILDWAKVDYPDITISTFTKASSSSSSVAVADEKKRDGKERKSDRDRDRDHKDHKDHKRRRRDSRSPSHDRSRSRRRRRSRSSSANTYSSGDSDEEGKKEEKRELKKKLREKEKLYNTRLSKWEEREDKMKRYYKKYERRKDEERTIVSEESSRTDETCGKSFDSRKREGERLRYFLEHYQDEKEDKKWYTGSELRRRKKQFRHQLEDDMKDREAELREIEELKALEAKTKEENAAAAAAAAAVAVAMDTTESQDTPPAEMTTEVKAETNKWTMSGLFNGSPEASTSSSSAPVAQAQPVVVATASPRVAATSSTPSSSSAAAPAVAKESSLSSRLQHVFGVDDEEEVDHMKTRKQLKPFEIDAKERLHMTEQERRILTREIVSKIPTKRDEVFSYKLDWSKLDDNMMNSKIIPWVSKKLATFIGEEDTALSDFVCQKVAQHKTPGDILLDIKIILDDDAELFVMKLWRLLIFEIEAKKIGLPTDR